MITYLSILLNALRTDRDDERGASAVEYGLLIAGIAALVVVVVFAFGDTIKASSRHLRRVTPTARHD